jgi:hypothetical protein
MATFCRESETDQRFPHEDSGPLTLAFGSLFCAFVLSRLFEFHVLYTLALHLKTHQSIRVLPSTQTFRATPLCTVWRSFTTLLP